MNRQIEIGEMIIGMAIEYNERIGGARKEIRTGFNLLKKSTSPGRQC